MLPTFALRLSRSFQRCGFATVLLTGMVVGVPTQALAQEFLSIKGNTVNIRAKPTTKSEIAWELIKGYPLQVIERKEDWVRVKDFEGTLGWVHQPLTSDAPYYLVKVDELNLRAGPGTNHSVVSKLNKYEIVKTLEKNDQWAKVQTEDGSEGWMLQKFGWGW